MSHNNCEQTRPFIFFNYGLYFNFSPPFKCDFDFLDPPKSAKKIYYSNLERIRVTILEFFLSLN